MSNVTVRDGSTNEELRSRLVMRTAILWLFCHVEGKDENDWVRHVKHFEVEGKIPVGRLKKA